MKHLDFIKKCLESTIIKNHLIVEVFYQKKDNPMISGIYGRVSGDWNELFKAIDFWATDECTIFKQGDGDYILKCWLEFDNNQYWECEELVFSPTMEKIKSPQ